MNLLFDIDHTLIDTNKLRQLISAELIKALNIQRQEFEEAEIKYTKRLNYKNDFNPQDYLTVLSIELEAEFRVLSSIFFEKESLYRRSLYHETSKVIELLSKSFRLGIFSEGFTSFQSLKLSNSGINRYFDKGLKYIFRRKLSPESISKLSKPVVVIDDSREVVEALCSEKEIVPVWLNRKDDTNHSYIKTIHDLKFLISDSTPL